MLPAPHRMTDAADFTSAVRHGRRARTATVVVHRRVPTDGDSAAPALVGFVVSKSVGHSVTRHRVSRRLRAQVAPLLSSLPAGSATVVRALPAASDADSTKLGTDLRRAFGQLERSGRL